MLLKMLQLDVEILVFLLLFLLLIDKKIGEEMKKYTTETYPISFRYAFRQNVQFNECSLPEITLSGTAKLASTLNILVQYNVHDMLNMGNKFIGRVIFET